MKCRTVGRPKGSVSLVSHNARITKILNRFGANVHTSKVKAEITRLNKICKPENNIAINNSLDVKIAHARAKLLKEQIGMSKNTVGRISRLEWEMINDKLLAMNNPIKRVGRPKKNNVEELVVVHGRGRPKGSKNKVKEENVQELIAVRGRGRPKGSKNKVKEENVQELVAVRGRGRPKGSKNKKNVEMVEKSVEISL